MQNNTPLESAVIGVNNKRNEGKINIPKVNAAKSVAITKIATAGILYKIDINNAQFTNNLLPFILNLSLSSSFLLRKFFGNKLSCIAIYDNKTKIPIPIIATGTTPKYGLYLPTDALIIIIG